MTIPFLETDCKTQKITETAEPSYYSSSIYYGGQDVYPPTSNNNCSQHPVHRGGGVEDPNGSSASRGNWWQGINCLKIMTFSRLESKIKSSWFLFMIICFDCHMIDLFLCFCRIPLLLKTWYPVLV
ncbi:hypothetical protein HanPI659440_Chr09g0330351 [Helianthus annuus]|nr:hypothetical protein HanPI659440_Chr09g0330351 [Helianthus annuus]